VLIDSCHVWFGFAAIDTMGIFNKVCMVEQKNFLMILVFVNDLEQDSTISRILKEENWSYSLIWLQCTGGSSMTLTT